LREKRYVVLDLFIIHAITDSNLDLFSKTVAVLRLIIDKCYTIILTNTLKSEYNKRMKELEREIKMKKRGVDINIALFKFLKRILTDGSKVEEVEEPSKEIPGEVNIPGDDLPIVRAALSRPTITTIVITTDRKDLVDNEALINYLKRENPRALIIHIDDYTKLDP
jgi:hypothetical protein